MLDEELSVYPILLAGGTGTRLWPVSRDQHPKQLASLTGKDSLIQSTVKRIASILDPKNIRVVCGQQHVSEIERHMKMIGVDAEGKVIGEPCGRNTAPAILLGALNILKEEDDAILGIFPADHVIRDKENFYKQVASAIKIAQLGYIVTFGINPLYPETGYGYIEVDIKKKIDKAYALKRFVEKPDMQTAQKYLKAGNFFWNSGMFAIKASVLIQEFRKYQRELIEKITKIVLKNDIVSLADYQQLSNVSIDYAIMEKTDKGVVLPSDFGWSDIGSWKSLYDFFQKDENENVIKGDVISENTRNCFIMGDDRLIATNDLNGVAVIDTADSLFVSSLDSSRDVKSIVAILRVKKRDEYNVHKVQYHSWGKSDVLDRKDKYSIDNIFIYPSAELQVEPDLSSIIHYAVIEGSVQVTYEGTKVNNFNRGEALTVSGGNIIKFVNTGSTVLHITQIMVKGIELTYKGIKASYESTVT